MSEEIKIPPINLDDCELIGCPKCGYKEYREVVKLRRVSGLMVPNIPAGNDGLVMNKELKCMKCGAVVTVGNGKMIGVIPMKKEITLNDLVKKSEATS